MINQQYNAETIKTLDYFEHIRQYPGMYIGSKDQKGLLHCTKEIISNSIDEYLNGAGSSITVKIQADGGFFVKDNGRGIPHGIHESGCSVLQACYGIANTGGKFDNATGQTGYNTSGGEHGTGGKAVNALSTKMVVSTAREGYREIVEFSRGKFIKYSQEKTEETGVTVLFYPDAEIFENINFDSEAIEKMIQEFSFLCAGLEFIFIDENKNKNKTFYSKNGLEDYINYLTTNKNLLFPPIHFNKKKGFFQVEIALAYTDGYNNIVKLYTNNIPQEKGTHLTGFKTALTTSFNQFLRDKKWLKDKDENLTGGDLEEGQVLVLNFKMIDPVFKGQNKEELSSSEGRSYVQSLATEALKEYFISHEKEMKILADKALSARKAREAAKKARNAVRDKELKGNKNKLLNLPTKLVDCWGKDRSKCELLIAEGDSAASGLVEARTAEIHAVFPIRGKLISTYKNSSEKIFANQEVVNIIKALGLELNPKTNKLIYDPKKLRYGKILLCADADADGSAIRNLLIEFFWWICPELILNGHVYTTMPPLFRITTKKNQYIFLKDNKALEEYKEAHKNEKYLINRNKGLGESDAEELADALLNPETRNIAQLVVNNIKETENLIECLLGPSVPPRRAYLLAHSEEANEND